ncbi:hypothetical protein [Nodularia sp. NIES-3585]|uniref:hypothetical protein n=1 Tax=Nodularia sp. NIES-3585 TaxID=1973477 RepID=UPI000B5D013F|nr:hypothetical protein [Nodularia sp. NIES-3585]GAX38978.1 hypothetical protein NIES3585_50300 [Nodularia sp. NIES-3585]
MNKREQDSCLTKTALNHLYKEFSKLESLLHNLSQKSLLEKANLLSNKEIKLKKTSLRKIERGQECRKFLEDWLLKQRQLTSNKYSNSQL